MRKTKIETSRNQSKMMASTTKKPTIFSSSTTMAIVGIIFTTLLFAPLIRCAPQSLSSSSSSSSSSQYDICDIAHSIIYCTCDKSPEPQELVCFATTNNGTAEDSIWRHFEAQGGSPASTVQVLKLSAFQGRKFRYFPAAAIRSFTRTLARLELVQLAIEQLPAGAISDMSALEHIAFESCENMTIARHAIGRLPRLRRVSFNDGNLQTITQIFAECPAIEELFFNQNHIETIENGAFATLGSLRYLVLDDNEIVHLARDQFTGLTRLTELSIQRNRLAYIPPFAFAEIHALRRVDLSYNEIATVDADAFSRLHDLQEIVLANNRLSGFPADDLFAASRSISLLDLSFNEFDRLHWKTFYQPKSDKYIRMKIKGNAIQCTCELRWMARALRFYDSIVRQELQSDSCRYDRLDRSLSAAISALESRPKSIYDFLRNKAIKQACPAISDLPPGEDIADEEDAEDAEETQDELHDNRKNGEKIGEEEIEAGEEEENETKQIETAKNEKNSLLPPPPPPADDQEPIEISKLVRIAPSSPEEKSADSSPHHKMRTASDLSTIKPSKSENLPKIENEKSQNNDGGRRSKSNDVDNGISNGKNLSQASIGGRDRGDSGATGVAHNPIMMSVGIAIFIIFLFFNNSIYI